MPPKEDKRSEFGRVIDIRLAALGYSQKELIDAVAEKTGKYFDSSYLHRIRHGKANSPVICGAIKEILEIDI